VLGLVLVAAFFRPQGEAVGWQLPAIAWVFVTLGMSTAVGAVVYATLTNFQGRAETTVVMLGSICFTAGLASFLRLSPIAVCFIAGMLVANFPGPWKDRVRDALERLERPVYLIFLAIAGALWRVGEWQGWALLVLFVVARLAGKRVGVLLLRRNRTSMLTLEEQRVLSVSPMGSLAIGIVVSAQDLYSGPTVPWIVTAVIGGAIVTEVIVQVAERRDKRRLLQATER
jgi:Kef-type K+ transport system membrane component KefB